jgi:hypothetical protein
MSSTITALTSGGGLAMAGDTSGQLELKTNNGTTAVTVDTGQRVGVNATAPRRNLEVAGTIAAPTALATAISTSASGTVVVADTGTTVGAVVGTALNGSSYDTYIQARNMGGANTPYNLILNPLGGNVLVGTSTPLGRFTGDIGSNAFTSGDASAFLNWRATSGGARPCIQVQSIATGQDVAFRTAGYDGTTSYYWTFGQNIASSVGNLDFMYSTVAGTQTSGAGTVQIRFTNSGQVYNTSGTYGTISDIKLKENIVDATPKLDSLLQLKVRNFTLKADETKAKQLGFVAQEVQEVFPSCVESFDDIDPDTKEKTGETLTVKTAILIPMLVKAIQELNAKVDAQAVEIAILKGK